MTVFTVLFRTEAECAVDEIEAETAELALAAARNIAANRRHSLLFEPYEGPFAVNEIAVCDEDGSDELAVWSDDDLRLRLAGKDLLAAARLVIARWESGDLAEAVGELSAAVAKAEGGAA
jgi:hypothetical protein